MCVAVAMLCKEQGITVTGVCGIYEVFVAQKVSHLFMNTIPQSHLFSMCLLFCLCICG